MSLSDAILAGAMLESTFSSGNGLPHITLNATEIVFGEAVEIAEDDNNVLMALVSDMLARGGILPLILTFSSDGSKMTLICAAIENEDGNSRAITYIGNMTSGGATIEVVFVALPPAGAVPTITVTIAE